MGKNILVEDHDLSIDKEENISISTNNSNFLELPSQGKCGYDSKVEYRDMLVQDEERLASTTPDMYATTLNSVIKSVLMDNKQFENFTVADRDYALVWIWANNYTPTKKVGITCANQKCKHEFESVVDLTKLEVTYPKENFVREMKLPINKTKGHVTVRLNKVRDEIQVEEYMKKHPDASYDYLMLIASIDIGAPLPFDKKVDWVRNNVSTVELGRVKQYHKYFAYGLPTIVEHTCPKCKEVTKSVIPFQGSDILFPQLSGDFEQFLQSNQDS
jgi:hypothetical protein